MADEKYTFGTARIRLEEIAAEVRKKDTSLEKSLDLLEEGVRLANICTELVDHTDLSVQVVADAEAGDTTADEGATDGTGDAAAESAGAAADADAEAGDAPADERVGDDVDEDYDDEDEPSDAASAE